MNDTYFPKIALITAEPPHSAAAGAILFQRLFATYPQDRLVVVTNQLPPAFATRLACRYAHVPLLADRLLKTRFWIWRNNLRALGAPALLSCHRLDTALANFAPEIVVTLMQDSWYYEYAAFYARMRGLPFVLFIHDLPDGFEPVVPWLRSRQLRRDGNIYRQAAKRLCISGPMRAHFHSQFAVDGDVIHPPRSDSPVSQAPELCARLKTPGTLTLGYAGGLHYGYGEQLLRILPILRETGTRLEYFGPWPTAKVGALGAATDVVRYNGYAATPAAAWGVLRDRCDALLLPYLDPPGPHALQYRTHFPSKLGDCLSLGLPLLITGPADASGITWCRDHGACALAVESPDPTVLRQALVKIRDEPDLRIELARRGQLAAREFSAPALRTMLHAILADITAP